MKKTFKQKIVYSLLNKIFYKVDHIVNQCNAMKDDLLSLHSLNPKNISVIYNPVNTFGLLKKRLNFIRRFRSLKSSYDLLSYELP